MTGLAKAPFSEEDILLQAVNPRELHLIVLPTEKCNFRCKYCFENHSGPRMSKATIKSLLAYIDRSLDQLDFFSIDWFGGEPLLELSTIQLVNKYVQKQIEAKSLKATFLSGMTTNGYLLTPDVLDCLFRVGITQFQITLDGPKGIHDNTRVHRTGKKTFQRIWRNLLAIKNCSEQLEVLIRIHLMRQNKDYLVDFIDEIDFTFGKDARFKIFFKPIADLGGDGKFFSQNQILRNTETVVKNLEMRLKRGGFSWTPSPVCHASKLNHNVIRADGSIARCTTALYDPINHVGRISSDGRLALDRDKIILWSRGLFSMDSDQLYCPYGNIKTANLNECQNK